MLASLFQRRTLMTLLTSSLVAAKRSSTVASRKVSPQPDGFYFKQLVAGKDFALTSGNKVHEFARQMNNFIYIIGDKYEGVAAVIDGAWDLESVNEITAADNLTLTTFIATHHHWDHIGGNVNGIKIPGIYEWANQGLEAHVPAQEKDIVIKQTGLDSSHLHVFEDGQCMSIGNYVVEFIHTPGHSPGSSCLRVTTRFNNEKDISDIMLITGDTVFPGSCGRLDLPGSDKHIMLDSLRKLSDLNDSLPIYPGHGYGGDSSTIGQEKQTGLLQRISRDQWKRMMG